MTTTDYNAAAEAVQKLVAGNDEQQALLRSVLPVLVNLTALQAEEVTIRERIKAVQAEERSAIDKRDLAQVEAGAFIGAFREARDEKQAELAALDQKIAQARKAAAKVG